MKMISHTCTFSPAMTEALNREERPQAEIKRERGNYSFIYDDDERISRSNMR